MKNFQEKSLGAIEFVLNANEKFAVDYDPSQISPKPRLHLAVLTCMDTRLSRAALGLGAGDAHLIRNAGGIVTADALRSLLISHYLLETREIMVINHTDCGLMKATEEELHEQIETKAGLPANTPINFHAFKDPFVNVRQQVEILKSHSWINEDKVPIRGFVFDVVTGHLIEA